MGLSLLPALSAWLLLHFNWPRLAMGTAKSFETNKSSESKNEEVMTG